MRINGYSVVRLPIRAATGIGLDLPHLARRQADHNRALKTRHIERGQFTFKEPNRMTRAGLLVLISVTAACAAPVPSPLPNSTALTKTIELAGPGSRPNLSVNAPRDWAHSFEAGIDTQRHRVGGQSASVVFEFWALPPSYACRDAGCGFATITVNGSASTIVRQREGFVAFVPRAAEQSRRGVSVSASCASAADCAVAEAVLMSLKFDKGT